MASYALYDDSEFGNEYQRIKTVAPGDPDNVLLRRGTYLYLSHATANRLAGTPAYIADVMSSYENAIRMYELGRFRECKDSVFKALMVMKAYDEAYGEYRKWESPVSIASKINTPEEAENKLISTFGLRSGLDILLLSKLQVLDDCMTCRTWGGYYDPNISLFKTINRILDFRMDKCPTNVQAEFCEFVFRFVYENSIFAYEKAAKRILRLSSKDEWEANFEKKNLDKSKDEFKIVLSRIVQRALALSESPDFDIRYLRFVYRIQNSPEKEAIDAETASSLDASLMIALRARCDEYQKALQEYESDRLRQIEMLDARQNEIRSSHAGFGLISPAKMLRRSAALKEIKEKRSTLQRELDNAESAVASKIWVSLDHGTSINWID